MVTTGWILRVHLNTTEQELQNLLVANNPEELQRFLRIYATDDASREATIAKLLTRANAFSAERLDVAATGVSRPVVGLKALLESIGLKLEQIDAADIRAATTDIEMTLQEEDYEETLPDDEDV